MKIKTFRIPVLEPELAEKELNVYLAAHRILNVERNFVADGQGSYWAVFICSNDLDPREESARSGDATDYREELSPEDFTVYSRLREIRKEISTQERIPAYRVFTNRQLAKMARQRTRTRSELESIAGVGVARAEKYGDVFLRTIASLGKESEGGKSSKESAHEDEPANS